MKVALNSTKGFVSSANMSGDVKGFVSADLSAEIYGDQTTTETKVDVDGKLSPGSKTELQSSIMNEELSINGVSVNPFELRRTISDAVDGAKKYIESEIENLKKLVNRGNN